LEVNIMGSTKAPNPPAPAEIQPYSEIYQQGGKTQATRLYDPRTRTFTTNATFTGADKTTEDTTSAGLANLAKQASGFSTSPEKLASYQEMLAEPQRRAVNSAFDKVQGNAILDASGNGMAQSAGMARYLANEVGQKRAESLADVERDAYLGRGQAMMADYAPMEQQANLLQALRQGGQVQSTAFSNQVNQGAQLGMGQMTSAANMAQQKYENQVNRYNSRQPSFFQRMMGT
jgi:hypothetical protein